MDEVKNVSGRKIREGEPVARVEKIDFLEKLCGIVDEVYDVTSAVSVHRLYCSTADTWYWKVLVRCIDDRDRIEIASADCDMAMRMTIVALKEFGRG